MNRAQHLESCNVTILGGGPAGATAALGLARRGVSVAILERSDFVGERIGETLPPTALPLLQRLGIWDAFQKDAHIPSPGIVSVWANEEPYENDFLFRPYGNGWHLDRTRFDRTLAESAEQVGATFVRSARVQRCIRKANQGWLLRYESEGALREITAAFLIDATGRSAWLARQQGGNRIVLDQLVGVIGFGECSQDGDHRTILEATSDGWWYSARLPNRKVVASFMTDADLLPSGRDNVKRFWREQLRNARLTTAIWSAQVCARKLRVAFCGSVRLDQVSGPGWMAVGDAAVGHDPLSSQGILNAMESGWRAAEIVADILRGNTTASAKYTQWMQSEFSTYLRNYFQYYSQVTRWPNSRFWRRRQSFLPVAPLTQSAKSVRGHPAFSWRSDTPL